LKYWGHTKTVRVDKSIAAKASHHYWIFYRTRTGYSDLSHALVAALGGRRHFAFARDVATTSLFEIEEKRLRRAMQVALLLQEIPKNAISMQTSFLTNNKKFGDSSGAFFP